MQQMSDSLKFNTSMQFTYGVADRMAEGVARLVAPNGGPLTFKGTNTYIVGTRELAVIDPGPDDDAAPLWPSSLRRPGARSPTSSQRTRIAITSTA